MKLNIGCGKHYQPGVINIDAYDTTIADVVCPAHVLPYDSNSIEAIEARHLVEHLGYFLTRYTLAEWFRVLQPQGTLLLETPDIDTAMKRYTTGSLTIRKEILTWMYGEDSPGMRHYLCYPEELLKDLVTKTGYHIDRLVQLDAKSSQPSLQLTCHKPNHAPVAQVLAEARGRIIESNIFPFTRQHGMLSHEILLDSFTDDLHAYLKTHTAGVVKKMFYRGAIQSPQSTAIVIEEAAAETLISKTLAEPYLHVLDFLSAINSPMVLLSLLQQYPCEPGTQRQSHDAVTVIAEKSVQKLLKNDADAAAIRATWESLSMATNRSKKFLFTPENIEEEAADLAYQAVRCAYQDEFTTAIDFFQQAVHLDRNRLLYYWNLARLYAAQHDPKQAKTYYDMTLSLAKHLTGTTATRLQHTLEQESNALPSFTWTGPITEAP